jgi:glycosyltransferase involved in cell wall biosynthesis
MKKLDLTIVIPTRNRSALLLKTLNYLKKNSFFFKEVIVVDSSEELHKKKIRNSKIFKKLNIKFFNSKPSAALQRNIGLQNAYKKRKFIMFLDDDINFQKEAIKNMYDFIKNNNNYIGFGFNFNIKNINTISEILKKNKLTKFLGIYDINDGVVTPSGWHTKAINLRKNQLVEWLPTGAVIYKKKYIGNLKFDTAYGKYSYLEDLDFSYSMKKRGNLIICASARFYTDNASIRNQYYFGLKEILNRYYFVNKFKLFKINFYIGFTILFMKHLIILMSFKPSFFLRIIGNIHGIFKIICGFKN